MRGVHSGPWAQLFGCVNGTVWMCEPNGLDVSCCMNSAGVTKASFRDYLVGCLGIVPGTIAFVFIGASTAGTMHEEVSEEEN